MSGYIYNATIGDITIKYDIIQNLVLFFILKHIIAYLINAKNPIVNSSNLVVDMIKNENSMHCGDPALRYL
jgi:hypothetical protein